MGSERDNRQNRADTDARHDLKNYLDTIIQTSHDGIFVVDREGRFEFGNEAFFQILGWPADELIGHDFIKVIPPDFHEFILERWEEVQAGKGEPYEVDIVRKNGQRRSLLVSHRHMTIAGQRKYCVIAKDVTESKQAEEALKRNHNLMHAVMEGISDPIFLKDCEGRYILLNTATARGLGKSSVDEVIGTDDRAHLPADVASKLQDYDRRVMASGEPEDLRETIEIAGSERLYRTTKSPYHDEEGNVLGVIGIARDLTEHKQAQDKLREKSMRESLILRSLPMAFYIGQPFGDYGGTWVSEQIVDVCGFTADQFVEDIGLWAARLHPDDRERALGAFDELLEKGVIEVEYRWRAADGRYLWFLDQAVLVRDESGNPKEIIGTWLDITERKQIEDELERHRIHLEEMVEVRTSELTQAQEDLRSVHRRLLNAGEDERRHLAAELHDSVGQKLVAMSLGIQRTIVGCGDTSGHEAEIEALRNMGQQCTETIQEIRTICYGLYPPMLELTGLADSLRQLGRSCQPSVNFQLQCDDSLSEARFDPEQEIALFRMAQEAVSNALRHGKAKNIRISLKRQANVLTMTVCDDGVGFDTDSKLRQGLGLRSMTERARAVDGTIEITSQPGKTSIRASLPIERPESPDA
ncbi:MAG: PAS domain S-box protein [Phycisphaerae bacterium]|jgi:two-component system sensor histidine kinase UhpB|nr:PAS domain S-box protein [Phycisphaerae bacterium]